MRPWRSMISIMRARSGGPPPASLTASAASRKYSGPMAAGVITQSALTSRSVLLSNRWIAPRGMREVECEWSAELGPKEFAQLKRLLFRVWQSTLVKAPRRIPIFN